MKTHYHLHEVDHEGGVLSAREAAEVVAAHRGHPALKAVRHWVRARAAERCAEGRVIPRGLVMPTGEWRAQCAGEANALEDLFRDLWALENGEPLPGAE